MESNPFVIDLQQEEDLLTETINGLLAEREWVRKMMARKLQEQNDPAVPPEKKHVRVIRYGPVEAVRKQFDEHPAKEWAASEVVKEVQKLKDQGLLKSKAKKVFGAVHTALLSLVKTNYIIRHEGRGPRGNPTYTRNITQQESAPPADQAEGALPRTSGRGVG